jgi:uncharacterized protein YjiS (DUF1127 family)
MAFISLLPARHSDDSPTVRRAVRQSDCRSSLSALLRLAADQLEDVVLPRSEIQVKPAAFKLSAVAIAGE